ncbi:MAG: hypothetical protein RL213_1054 [Bacteroidota bacterium]|jgi:CYTH domain-containing protein
MFLEIEHKYLVDRQSWSPSLAVRSSRILQGYLVREPKKTVRVRIKENEEGSFGFLTLKGPSSGASRAEFEYPVPAEDARFMLELFCRNVIEKTRYDVLFEGKKWEVDVFEGENAGLVVAEIELSSPDESYEKPGWIKDNVTDDPRYSNAALSERPFRSW